MDVSTSGSPINATSTVSITLDSQPSCIEFAKTDHLLVVGTYNLEPSQTVEQAASKSGDRDLAVEIPAQKRSGSLLVFHITKQTATLLQTKILPYALLDLHFSPSKPSSFAVATSVGSVCIFSIDLEDGGTLTFLKSIRVCDSSILVLSLAYYVPDFRTKLSLIAVSLSNGHLAVFDGEQEDDGIVAFPAHDQEAWTVAWSKAPGDLNGSQCFIHSGGDDSALCKHSASFPSPNTNIETKIDQYQTLSRDLRTHGAGVTAIVVLPVCHEGQEILLTGSYDEHVRILLPPTHERGRAKVLAESHLGGGVWRISNPFASEMSPCDNSVSFKVLASCMHAGARVLEIHREAGTWSIKILAKFTEHESMNYASDVQQDEGDYTFVSTSFYDRKLCIWNLKDSKHFLSNSQQNPI